MRKVSESPLWKKVTAAICMVALLVTSFYFVPNEKVKASGEDVSFIRLKSAGNIIWCDDEGEEFTDYYQEDEESSLSGSETYEFRIDGDDIIVYPSEGTFSRRVLFYINANGKPDVMSNSESGAKTTVSDGTSSYKVSVNLINAAGEVILTPTPQYNVTFPFDSDEYTITQYGSNTSYAGETVQVKANETLRFSVKLDDSLSLSKSIKVTANGKTLPKDADSTSTCYNYTLDQVEQNTTIAVASVNKTYTVSLPSSIDGYTVSSAGGGNIIEVGGTYNFYITPEDGYIKPASVNANYGKVVSLGNNLYQLSLAKEDIESFDGDTIEITLEGTGKETLNVIYRTGTEYIIQNESGETLTTETVTYGEQLKFKVVAKDGYEITGVYANNLPVEAENADEGRYVTAPITTTTTVTVSTAMKNYHITTPEVKDGYTFLGTGSITVTHGGSYSFIVTAAPGYEEPTVYAYPGSEANEEYRTEEYKLTGVNGTYVVGNVDSDMYIDVQAGSKIQYNVNFPSGLEYTFSDISIGGSATAEYGIEVSFKVRPSEGYSITSVRANNTILSESEDGLYAFIVTEDTVIGVVVEKKTYSVTIPEASGAYTFTPLGSSPVEYGGSYSFYITANEKYNQPTVSYKMGDESRSILPVSDNLYVIHQISGDVTIEVEPGSLKTQTVHLNPKEGVTFRNVTTGGIDSSSVSVNYGESYSFKLELSSDYNESIPYVTVNNVHIQPDENGVYTISDIKADQVVSVTNVEKNIYTITFRQEAGYTLTTTESTNVEAGNSFTFALSATTGYDLSNASVYYKTVDGEPVLVEKLGGYYTISKVSDNIEIYVTGVSQITFKVNRDPDDKATVAPVEGSNLENIAYNGSISFTVEPNEYYELTQVAVNGEVKEAVNGIYTVNNITSDVNIQVITTPKTLITVEYRDAKFENSGTESFTIEDIKRGDAEIKTPVYSSTSYTFAGWFDEKEELWASGQKLTEEDIDSNIVLTAEWALTENVLEKLVTEGAITNTDNSQFVVTISTLLHFAEDLEESDKSNIMIVGYGTLYAPKEFTIDEEVKSKVQGRSHVESGFFTDTITEGLLNYYYNCSTPANEFNSAGFAIAATSANKPKQRWGAGWIAIQLNGSDSGTIYVYAQPVEVRDTTVNIEQALADVIGANPSDQTSSETSDVSAQNDEVERENKGLEEALSVEETQTELSTEEVQAESIVDEAREEAAEDETQTEPAAEETESPAEEAKAECIEEEIQADSTEAEAQTDPVANGQMMEAIVE